MKTGYKPPNKRKYFHTKKKIDTQDSTYLKNRIDLILNREHKRKEHREI
ncbi:MAG: hypothetical protein LN408_04855 [Candidatus Thermoplasmatota archaeon]|nr:hypothetical protein [Candidatus Thermoplasmatota archaeon]